MRWAEIDVTQGNEKGNVSSMGVRCTGGGGVRWGRSEVGEVAGEGMTKGRSEVEKQRGKVGQGGRGVFLEGVRWDNADGILFLISEIDCAY